MNDQENPEHALPGETPTSECSEIEIVAHRAWGTLRVTPSGLGFVRRPKDQPGYVREVRRFT